VLVASCAAPETASDPPDAMSATGDSQLPPQGHTALAAWLADGHYLAWACEPTAHPARPPGAHGANRICSNAALSGSASGLYPVGAASVKELYRNGSIEGHAVGIKLTAGSDANSWYWYEAIGASVIADGAGRASCANCHAGAPRDNVFTHVR
jgi:hypothetical protein